MRKQGDREYSYLLKVTKPITKKYLKLDLLSLSLLATCIGHHDRVKTKMTLLEAITHFLQNEPSLTKYSLVPFPSE